MRFLTLTILLLFFTMVTQTLVYADEQVFPTNSSGKTLLVSSGSGQTEPMKEVCWLYENQTGTKIDLNILGSISQIYEMSANHTGDVYVSGGTSEYANASRQGLVNPSPALIAYRIPVILVQKGNPKNITSLEDFADPGINVVLADPSKSATARASNLIFSNLGILDDVNKNVKMRPGTVDELIDAMKNGMDTTIIARELITTKDLDIIDIPIDKNKVMVIAAGQTTYTKDPDTAQDFVNFLNSSASKEIFEKDGFPPYPDCGYIK